jgi:hypothetical protein
MEGRRMSEPGTETAGAAPPRRRRQRSAQESLASIILGFEVIVVFLGALVVFGLHALPPAPALIGGGIIIVLMLLAIPLLRFRIGYWIGWLVQLIVVASGLLVGMLFIVGALFTAIWVYAMVTGARLDRGTARAQAAITPPADVAGPDTIGKEKP